MSPLVRFRKSSAYYCTVFCLIGLCVGVSTLILGGQSIVIDEGEEAAHNNPMFVLHESGERLHDQTAAGDIVLGKPAHAHIPGTGAVTTEDARWYCGHDQRWETFNGVLHKMDFIRHPDGRPAYHRWKTAHFAWAGTGYVRTSDWWYSISRCH